MKTIRLFIFVSLAILWSSSSHAQTLDWIDQFGTSDHDFSGGVSSDGMGGIYTTGSTHGDLQGSHAGSGDAYIRKYNSSGVVQWTRQFGTGEEDRGWGISADALGNIFVSGSTRGDLEGTNAGTQDVFLARYDLNGLHQWTRQFGSEFSEKANDNSADGLGNVYVVGWTNGDLGGPHVGVPGGEHDAFVAKYDSDGIHQWTSQLGSEPSDSFYGASADTSGNVFVAGITEGDLDGVNAGRTDAILVKYDTDGNHQWTRQFGTSEDESGWGDVDVAADVFGNAFISGSTGGDLEGFSAGSHDAFLAKYDDDGNQLWMTQFGTSARDYLVTGLDTDASGNAYVSGSTYGNLGGVNAGEYDIFLAKFNASGTQLWTRQFGSSDHERYSDVSVDGLEGVFVSGRTRGDLEGTHMGGITDAFLAKYIEPTPGDFNGDGVADGQDFLSWQRGKSPEPHSPADLSAWQTNYGAASSLATTQVVPEPSTWVFIACVIVGLLLAGHRGASTLAN